MRRTPLPSTASFSCKSREYLPLQSLDGLFQLDTLWTQVVAGAPVLVEGFLRLVVLAVQHRQLLFLRLKYFKKVKKKTNLKSGGKEETRDMLII